MGELTVVPPKTTRAKRLSWFPIASAVGGFVVGASTGGLGWLAAGAGALVASASGFGLWRWHQEERAELDEAAFEKRCIALYRNHVGTEMTKEQLVMDHGLHPRDADRILEWLTSHDLLDADWENFDGPVIYRRREDGIDDIPSTDVGPHPNFAPHPVAGAGAPPYPAPQYTRHPTAPPPRNPVIAGILSGIWPGVGQMYCGRVKRGLFCLPLMLAPPIGNIIAAIDAVRLANEMNDEALALQDQRVGREVRLGGPPQRKALPHHDPGAHRGW